MTIPCKECGYPLNGNETTCPECGCLVNEPTNKGEYKCEAISSSDPIKSDESSLSCAQDHGLCDSPKYGANHKNNKKVWWSLSSIILIIVLGVGIYYFCFIPPHCGADHEYVNYTKEQLLSLADKNDYEALTQLGRNAFASKNYEEAIIYTRKAAEKDYPAAQYNLAIAYANGYGLEKNDKEAFKWAMKAAEKGFTDAEGFVGKCYVFGNGVAENATEGFTWLKKTAEKGSIDGMVLIGSLYLEGKGIPVNKEEGVKWMKKAAAANDSEAQLVLATLYHDGNGVKKNYKEASKWLTKAAESGSIEAQKTLARAYNSGDYGLIKDMNKGLEWFRKAADQGDEEAKEGLKSTESFLEAEIEAKKQIEMEERKLNNESLQNNQYNNEKSEEEIRRYNETARELPILAKIEELTRRMKSMGPDIEVLYRAYQRNRDPESMFRLREGLDMVIGLKSQQIRLAEQLSDNAKIIRELKEQREQMYKAKDMMLYGKAARPSWTW